MIVGLLVVLLFNFQSSLLHFSFALIDESSSVMMVFTCYGSSNPVIHISNRSIFEDTNGTTSSKNDDRVNPIRVIRRAIESNME